MQEWGPQTWRLVPNSLLSPFSGAQWPGWKIHNSPKDLNVMLSWKLDKFPFFTFFSWFLFLCLWPSLLPDHPVLRQLVLSVWQYYSMLLINVIFQTFERNERYDEGAVEVRGSDWEKPFWENLPKGRRLQLYLIILWMSCGFFCLVFSCKLRISICLRERSNLCCSCNCIWPRAGGRAENK